MSVAAWSSMRWHVLGSDANRLGQRLQRCGLAKAGGSIRSRSRSEADLRMRLRHFGNRTGRRVESQLGTRRRGVVLARRAMERCSAMHVIAGWPVAIVERIGRTESILAAGSFLVDALLAPTAHPEDCK